MGRGESDKETKGCFRKDTRDGLPFRERHREDPPHIVLQRRHLVDEPLPSSGQIFKLGKAKRCGCQGLLPQQELGDGKGILLVCLRFSQGELREVCKGSLRPNQLIMAPRAGDKLQ